MGDITLISIIITIGVSMTSVENPGMVYSRQNLCIQLVLMFIPSKYDRNHRSSMECSTQIVRDLDELHNYHFERPLEYWQRQQQSHLEHLARPLITLYCSARTTCKDPLAQQRLPQRCYPVEKALWVTTSRGPGSACPSGESCHARRK